MRVAGRTQLLFMLLLGPTINSITITTIVTIIIYMKVFLLLLYIGYNNTTQNAPYFTAFVKLKPTAKYFKDMFCFLLIGLTY